MIPQKIQSLFKFIEYLHDNIEKINKYEDLFLEKNILETELLKLKPKENINDKEKYNVLKKKIDTKTELIKREIEEPIRTKFNELEIADWQNLNPSIFNIWGQIIYDSKSSFDINDKEIIQNIESKYLNIIDSTPLLFNQFVMFRELELGEILGGLFNYFHEQNDIPFESNIKNIRKKSGEKYIYKLKQNKSTNQPKDLIYLTYYYQKDEHSKYQVERDLTQQHHCKILIPLDKGNFESEYLPVTEFSKLYQKFVIGLAKDNFPNLKEKLNFIASEKEKLNTILKPVLKHDSDFKFICTQFNEFESTINSALLTVDSLIHIQSIINKYTLLVNYKSPNISHYHIDTINELKGFKIDINEAIKELNTIDIQDNFIKQAFLDFIYETCMPVYVAITTLSTSTTFELDHINIQFDQLIEVFKIIINKYYGNFESKNLENTANFYKVLLVNKIEDQPEQVPEIVEEISKVKDSAEIKDTTVKQNMHLHIFKDNAFYLFNKFFEDQKIQDSDRTKVRFIFDAMQKDTYIHSTVKQVDFLNWINDTYERNISKPNWSDYTKNPLLPYYNILKESYPNQDT